MKPPRGHGLARRLGVFDAMLIVMGGIIGSGIFRNPAVVAQRVHSSALIMLVWILGGIVALIGAGVFAELAARHPAEGGVYGYLRDAFHPVVAFMYGWTLLLVSQSGGMAAAAVTFAGYFTPLTGLHVAPWALAVLALALLTAVNCFGVRQGGNVQNVFMLLKIGAIALLIVVGLFGPSASSAAQHQSSMNAIDGMGVAMIPVLFAYSGWQTSSFVTAELHAPRRSLPFGMLAGVGAVIVLYLLVNAVCVRVLGPAHLMSTATPASDVMRSVLGPVGERIIALAVALSTLGFLSNQILTSPRVYHAMARDRVFFSAVAWVHPKSRVPVVAIALQGAVAIVIAVSGRYEQILNYVTSIDYVFFGLAALALIIFRIREKAGATGFGLPGYPVTAIAFIVVAWAVVLDTYVTYPKNSLIGLAILLIAVPIYFLFFKSEAGARGRTGFTRLER